MEVLRRAWHAFFSLTFTENDEIRVVISISHVAELLVKLGNVVQLLGRAPWLGDREN